MDDETLRRRVFSELDFEPSVGAGEIAVTVRNGVVTLTGHVSSLAQKLAAKQAVARVRGVRAIAQEIEVTPPQEVRADEDLARRAAKVLAWASALPENAIQVEVDHGVVTLSGEVEWDYQRRIAEQEVRGLAGVIDVKNLITLKFHHPAADIKGRIEEALGRSAMDTRALRISVEGGVVILAGRVGSWFDSDNTERVAWSVPGVRAVDNRLVIEDAGEEETAA
jgi:osmotically-inducible protein OsmY